MKVRRFISNWILKLSGEGQGFRRRASKLLAMTTALCNKEKESAINHKVLFLSSK